MLYEFITQPDLVQNVPFLQLYVFIIGRVEYNY